MKKPSIPASKAGRPRLNPERAMTTAERLQRSADERRARGERRLTGWITKEAATRLDELRATNPDLTEAEIVSARILGQKLK